MAEAVVVLSEFENSMKGGGTRADPLAMGIRDGEGESGGSNAANAFGAVEVPVIELGLLGTSGSEDDGVPGRSPGGMANG